MRGPIKTAIKKPQTLTSESNLKSFVKDIA